MNNDYFLPLPNGYWLTRLNGREIIIHDLLANEIVPARISKISIISDLLVGKRETVKERKVSSQFFVLDTSNDNVVYYDSFDEIQSFIADNRDIQNITLHDPKKIYNKYKNEIVLKKILAGNYHIIIFGKDNSYIVDYINGDNLDINPVSMAYDDKFIIGFSQESTSPLRGHRIIQGFFIIPFESSKPIHLGLSKEAFETFLVQYNIKAKPVNIEAFLSEVKSNSNPNKPILVKDLGEL
jgi:hypothetical protein